VLSDVAVSAVELNSLGGDFHSHFRGVQFRLGSLYAVNLLSRLCHGSLVNQQLGSLYLGSHVSQLELSVLELSDGTSELFSLFYIFDGGLQSAFRQTQGLRGDSDPSAVQSVHGDVEALALLSQQILLGDAAVG